MLLQLVPHHRRGRAGRRGIQGRPTGDTRRDEYAAGSCDADDDSDHHANKVCPVRTE
jgi:hypothetical protein